MTAGRPNRLVLGLIWPGSFFDLFEVELAQTALTSIAYH